MIMIFMVATTSFFIYSNMHLRDRITYRIVRQTEIISDLISRSATDLMRDGHDKETYSTILEYGNLIGVKDIAIFNLKGQEAFEIIDSDISKSLEGAGEIKSTLTEDDEIHFKKILSTFNMSDYFDHEGTTYKRFEPLLAARPCLRCHDQQNDMLGVLKFTLSTEDDFKVLKRVQRFIWALGFIVSMPLIGLLVIGAIIKDKNKLLDELHTANEDIKRTYHDLNETKYYLEMILNNSKAIIITTDTDGNIVEFNREAEALLEYSKYAVVGKSVLMLYEDPDERIKLVKGQTSQEVRLKSKSGKISHVSVTLSDLINDENEVIGTVGIGRDVSEQKMLQFKLLQSEKLAGIGTLASGIAHEINNPLAGILGMAEAIRDESDPETIKSYAEDIIQYSVNASIIVKELSSYSRTAHNEATSTVDISQVLENSIKMSKHSAPLTSINIETEMEENTYIFANAGELQQVFVNLIINAIHAMKDKGVLTIKCVNENGFAVVTISDTGEGIPLDNINQVFDPFFTTKPAGSGTGLGLYVVYRIVTKYGGTIELDSSPSTGTTFTIKFPSSKKKKSDEIII
jgi:PAS domain S-box-containing protein